MKQSQRQFRIGTLAHQLGVKKFVIRFWEKEFGISAQRSTGGQRFYKKKDLETFKLIKDLLYEQGFTIAGAKKILAQESAISSSYQPAGRVSNTAYTQEINSLLKKKIETLRSQLQELYKLL